MYFTLQLKPELFLKITSLSWYLIWLPLKEKTFLNDGTGELNVSDLADCIFIALINLDDCVTPATKIPMIKITIDNSISEKALLENFMNQLLKNNIFKKILK